MNPDTSSSDSADDASDCCEDKDSEGEDDGNDNDCFDDAEEGDSEGRSTRQETVTELAVTSSILRRGGFGGSATATRDTDSDKEAVRTVTRSEEA